MYQLIIKRTVSKDMKKFPLDIKRKLISAIESLREQPFPQTNLKKLQGSPNSYRLRVGDYRILYDVEEEIRIISVYKVGHRKDIYR